ncbi:DNA translocase FtsK [Candidatus Parcubacteria bacterium]|nr:MAG: DNA translocase FtsK [Candidatus Parcubacteria bacterium]
MPQTAVFKSKPLAQEADLWWQHPTGLRINFPLHLLKRKRGRPTSGDIKRNKEIIKNTLYNFGIPVEMGEVSVGPTVTQYTLKPAEGIKLSRIVNLSSNLSLALAARSIRIEAPIPGKSLVGIEVPNQTKAIVGLREILESDEFRQRKNNLTLVLGKDVAGKPWVYNLAKTPHLLVAGATNSGKSVCLNALITGLMYQNSPDELRFILVDPKRVELPFYNGTPYLLTPTITDVRQTVNALKWCLNEMERRFEILSRHNKRNIQSYNASVKTKMPYIVFVIDELADLMAIAGKEVEAGINRLTQMARAVGIHMIVATQRPSVDVVTGLIKANIPTRIAFFVTSGTDSRTILDCLGAEKLLGVGDMLFSAPDLPKPVRLQGAYVSEQEIKKIVENIKAQSGEPPYLDTITENQKVAGMPNFGGDEGGEIEDDLFEEAKELVIREGKASASHLQRRLKIGYNRAGRLIDMLEEAGIVGPANGSKPRKVLVSPDEYEGMQSQAVSGVALHSREEAEGWEEYLPDEEISGVAPVLRPEAETKEEDPEDNEEETNEDAKEEDKNNEEQNKQSNQRVDNSADLAKGKLGASPSLALNDSTPTKASADDNNSKSNKTNNGREAASSWEEDFGKYWSK